MTPAESRDALLQFADKRGVSLPSSVPKQGVSTMLQFFEDVRPGRSVIRGADWLLYQWGCYDWGRGENFELNITRQFVERIKVEGEFEEVISQLSLTYVFPLSDQNRAFGKGDRWCRSQSEVAPFREFIEKSGPFDALQDQNPTLATLDWSHV